jgi:hypothetical protein
MFRVLAYVALALCACSGSAFAQSSNGPLIFDVRRSLPLEPNEPVYKDFYINAGPEAGFKKGVYISVVRPIPVHDPIQNKQQGTLNIPVGHLQVIHVERGITVARLQDELADDERPTLEFEGVMVGDKIDLASMTTTAPKRPNAPKKGGGLFGAKPAAAGTSVANSELAPIVAAPPAVQPATEPKLEVKLEATSGDVALQASRPLNTTESSSVAPASTTAPVAAPRSSSSEPAAAPGRGANLVPAANPQAPNAAQAVAPAAEPAA